MKMMKSVHCFISVKAGIHPCFPASAYLNLPVINLSLPGQGEFLREGAEPPLTTLPLSEQTNQGLTQMSRLERGLGGKVKSDDKTEIPLM